MAEIKVYTTPDCPYCHRTKEWLRERDCPFRELDITSDVELLREWRELSGGAGVPVVAHGTDLVIGYNPERLQQLLDCSTHTSPVDEEEMRDRVAGGTDDGADDSERGTELSR